MPTIPKKLTLANEKQLQRLGNISVDVYEDMLLGQEYVPHILRKNKDLLASFISPVRSYYAWMENPSASWESAVEKVIAAFILLLEWELATVDSKTKLKHFNFFAHNAEAIGQASNLDDTEAKYNMMGKMRTKENAHEFFSHGEQVRTEKAFFLHKTSINRLYFSNQVEEFISVNYSTLKKYKYWMMRNIPSPHIIERIYQTDRPNPNYEASYITQAQYLSLPPNLQYEVLLLRKNTQEWTLDTTLFKDADQTLYALVETIFEDKTIPRRLPEWLRQLYINSKMRNFRLQKYL